MVMEYDKGTPTTFIITYACSKELEKGNGRHYPYITDGSGRPIKYDYRDYDIKADNILLKGKVEEIKYAYEEE